MAHVDQDPRVKALQWAVKQLASAQAEHDTALMDLLLHGPYGRQAAAERLTGLSRETLRLKVRDAEKTDIGRKSEAA